MMVLFCISVLNEVILLQVCLLHYSGPLVTPPSTHTHPAVLTVQTAFAGPCVV